MDVNVNILNITKQNPEIKPRGLISGIQDWYNIGNLFMQFIQIGQREEVQGINTFSKNAKKAFVKII